MKGKRRILAILLLVSIFVGFLPVSSTHVHAGYEDGQDCIHCGSYRYDDWLCDGCGGCSENADGNCYAENHCPECGNCTEFGLDHCQDCLRCDECITICQNCEKCYDCGAYGIEFFCEMCDQCASCMGEGYCEDHNVCGDCAQICSETGCTTCENCVDIFCGTCEKCQICAHDHFCQDCGDCSDHWEARCPNCETCTNCNGDSICEGCELVCAECSLVCPDCGKCEDCTGDDVCQDCGRCSDCGILCSDCGNYCADCAELFCSDCGICSECADICRNCWDACSDCSDMCGGCLEYCSDCADICEECGDACENCGNMCHDCWDVCSDCVPFCKGCDECQNCRGDFCSRCEEYCSFCADSCEDCGACEYCVDLCVNCGDYCPDCKEVCPNCEYCEDCADVCELCGEHCSNCEDWACEFCDISKSCKYHAYCDLCGMCQSDPQHLVCPDCGDHVTSHGTRKSIDENFHQTVCNCGKLFGDLEAHNIIYEVITEATETEEGLGQYYCSYRKSFGCTYHKEVTIPALGINHECVYDMWLPSWNGHKKMCACGKTDGENIAHINETIVLEEATEDKNGLAYDKCTVCGYNVAPYIIPATNHSHNYPDTWTYDNSGHWHECTCGDRSDEAYHNMGSWVTTKYPTTTSAGSKERTCTVCDFKEIVVIPALAEQVVVTFDSQGGSLVENKTVNNGSKVDKPTDPTKEGYNFMGWYTSTDYTNEWKFASSIYESMTLYAKWEIDPSLIFEVSIENDGNGIGNANPASASAGTEISLSYTANEGYKFKEWQVISGGVSIVDNKFTMPANPVVVKAVFEEIPLVSYTYDVTQGANSTWYKGDGEGLQFIIDGDFAIFEGVEINGKLIDGEYYRIEEGSVMVTLEPEYLEKLEIGEYIIGFVFSHMKVETRFNITKADETDPTDPVEPVDPTDPTDPTDPEDPVDPVDPTDPMNPTSPTDPSNPNNSIESVGTGETGETKEPIGEKLKETLPATGENNPFIFYLSGFLSLILGMFLLKRRKQVN